MAIVAFCVGGTWGLKELYAYGFANDVDWMVLVLGTVVPAVLFGISFMPQIVKMITSRSYEGVSFLSSALNIIAEVFAITGIVLNGGGADAYSPLIVLGVGQGVNFFSLSLLFPLHFSCFLLLPPPLFFCSITFHSISLVP